jgi:hypothetical protein
MKFLAFQDRCLITLYLTPEMALCPMLSPNCTKSSKECKDILHIGVLLNISVQYLCQSHTGMRT